MVVVITTTVPPVMTKLSNWPSFVFRGPFENKITSDSVVIIVPADVLAPLGARTSARTMMTKTALGIYEGLFFYQI